MRQTLIIVSGDPGSGKSMVSRAVAEALGIGVLAKDDLKEIIFDTLGWDDGAWSKRLSSASYELLWHSLDLILGSGASIILDSNLQAQSWEMIRRVLARHPCSVVELVCFADPTIVMERFQRRARSGERHPGHQDGENVAEFAARVAHAPPSPSIAGSRYAVIDTSGEIELTRTSAIALGRSLLGDSQTGVNGHVSN